MMKETIKKFKEWLIIKLGGYVEPLLLPSNAISYTYLKPNVYKITHMANMRNILLSDENYVKDLLYAKVKKEILPRISKITSEIIGDRKEYTLTIMAIDPQENDTGE